MNAAFSLAVLLLSPLHADAMRQQDWPDAEKIASLLPELRRFGGPNAHDCGMVPYGKDRTEAFSCVGRAEGRASPYWVAVQLQGIDSQIWSVAILTTSSEHILLQYDSDSSGGSESTPSPLFSYRKCRTFVLDAKSSRPIVCAHGL